MVCEFVIRLKTKTLLSFFTIEETLLTMSAAVRAAPKRDSFCCTSFPTVSSPLSAAYFLDDRSRTTKTAMQLQGKLYK